MNKFCKDCKWKRSGLLFWDGLGWICVNPKFGTSELDLVTGEIKVETRTCYFERFENIGGCKSAGIGWEPRQI